MTPVHVALRWAFVIAVAFVLQVADAVTGGAGQRVDAITDESRAEEQAQGQGEEHRDQGYRVLTQ